MLLRILRLLVDGDVEVGDANGPGALDLRDLVDLRHRHERAPKLQPMRAIRVVGKALRVLLVIPVGAIEDRHDIPIRLCLLPPIAPVWRRRPACQFPGFWVLRPVASLHLAGRSARIVRQGFVGRQDVLSRGTSSADQHADLI